MNRWFTMPMRACRNRWPNDSIVYRSVHHPRPNKELPSSKLDIIYTWCLMINVRDLGHFHRFAKDPDGSLGILIARGVRGGIYLMGLTPNGAAHRQTSLKPGKEHKSFHLLMGPSRWGFFFSLFTETWLTAFPLSRLGRPSWFNRGHPRFKFYYS